MWCVFFFAIVDTCLPLKITTNCWFLSGLQVVGWVPVRTKPFATTSFHVPINQNTKSVISFIDVSSTEVWNINIVDRTTKRDRIIIVFVLINIPSPWIKLNSNTIIKYLNSTNKSMIWLIVIGSPRVNIDDYDY